MKIVAVLALLLLFAGAAYSTAESEELETLLGEFDDDGNLGNLQEDTDIADESDDSEDETEDTDSDDEGDNEVGRKKKCSCRNCYRFCRFRIKSYYRKCFYHTRPRCFKYGKSKRCYHYCHSLLSHSSCPRRVRFPLSRKFCSIKQPIFCSNRYGVKG